MKAKNIDAPSEKPHDGPSHFTTWLTTINADGSPHVTAVGAVWDGDTFWFQTADRTRKAKNIVRDQRCAVSLTLDGCDVVVEGNAEKVADPDDVARIAGIWATRGGWPVTPDEHGTGLTAPFNAPGLGSAPWFVYRVTPAAATSVTQQGESTRWTF